MSTPKGNRQIVRLRGHVTAERVKKGTGSEHVGVVLRTPRGEKLTLVRLGGNPFDDAETRRLVGRDVEVRGYRIGSELRYIEVRETTGEEEDPGTLPRE